MLSVVEPTHHHHSHCRDRRPDRAKIVRAWCTSFAMKPPTQRSVTKLFRYTRVYNQDKARGPWRVGKAGESKRQNWGVVRKPTYG